jgi:hypothetical protein
VIDRGIDRDPVKPGLEGRFKFEGAEAFMKPEALNMTFKTFLRTAEQIQRREDGTPVSGVIPLYAHELQLFKQAETYPADMVSPKERTAHRKKFGTTKIKPRRKRIPRA